jgi:iron donor protein CyaY
MDDQLFRNRADAALADLYRRLTHASEEHGFEADFNSGAMSIEFEDPPAKFVVSPNAPVHQVWVSAHSRSFKLEWEDARGAFVLPSTKQTLVEMMGEAIGQQLGESVSL